MAIDLQLTDEQKRIVEFDEGALLVQAGPGSGKTAVLTQRLIRLLRKSSGESFRILALTFTTKAAENMRQRVEKEIGDEWRRATITTFHGFGLDVLQHYGSHIGLELPLSVYEQEEDRMALLAKGLMQEGLVIRDGKGHAASDDLLKRLLFQIGRHKRDLILPEAIAERDEESRYFKIAYQAYNRQLELHHALDFEDLLIHTYRLFVQASRVARHYRKIYRYILVDEAQDTSRAQYEILKALCDIEHRNVMMVADSDQFIYRFAGASDRYLKLFKRDFQAQILPLSHNFRSSAAIVEYANRLIRHNNRMPGAPEMVAVAHEKESFVRYIEQETPEQEADFVAGEISRLLRKRTRQHHKTVFLEMAVLGRNRYLLEPFRKSLEKKAIPYYFKTSTESVFAAKECRLFHLMLRVLHNPFDLLHQEQLVVELGLDAYKFLEKEEAKYNTILPESFFYQLIEETSISACWKELFSFLCDRTATLAFPAYFEELLSMFEERVLPCEQTEAAGDELLLRDIQLLKERFRCFSHKTAPDDRSLEGFLADLALSGREGVEDEGVRILTLHAAKGLEFETVFLIGMNQGSFPDYRSLRQPGGLEEERRNAYVAITRAKRQLYLTRCRKRPMPWGEIKTQQPSCFLNEMQIAVD